MRRVFICIPCFGLLCCSYCADLQKDCRMVVLTKLSDMCTCLALAKPVCVSVFVSLCFIEFAYICTINGEFAAVSSIFVCVYGTHSVAKDMRMFLGSVRLLVVACVTWWRPHVCCWIQNKTKNISISVFNVVIVTLVWLCVFLEWQRVIFISSDKTEHQVQRKTPDAFAITLELLCREQRQSTNDSVWLKWKSFRRQQANVLEDVCLLNVCTFFHEWIHKI